MGFLLFILLNATLFIRPAEIVSGLEGAPIYQCIILCCLAVAFPRVFELFSREAVVSRPINVCVVCVWVAVVVSHLARLNTFDARETGFEFGKVILYFLLVVALVDTPARLRELLLWLAAFITILAAIAVLHYHGHIEIPSLTILEEREWNSETHEFEITPRLRSTGIFNDPNDLSLILGVGILISLYFAGEKSRGPVRFIWLAPVVLFGYTLVLTKSRGGLLGIGTGLLILSYARYGWRKTAAVAMLAVPLLLAAGGRQTNFNIDKTDTGQQRVQFWAEGVLLFKQSPLFGIGAAQFVEEVRHVAHNSFVQAYVELGFLGGTVFVGGYYCAVQGLRRLRFIPAGYVDPELARMRPYLMAMILGYVVGMLSLSVNYVQPTYLPLALASIYIRLNEEETGIQTLRLDGRLVKRLVLVSILCVVTMYISIRLMSRWE